MATVDKQNEDFESAFNEDTAPATEQTEDEAFGIKPDAPAEDGGAPMTGEPAAVVIVAEPAPAAEAPGDEAAASKEAAENETAAATAKAATDEANAKASVEAATPSTGSQEAAGDAGGGESAATALTGEEESATGESPSGDIAAAVTSEGEGSGVTEPAKAPMSEQQLRSWEGRLRKAEADLKAKTDGDALGQPEGTPGANTETTTADALDQVADQTPDASLATAATEVADQVAAGEITPEQAMAQLAEDFGEPFVKMIETIARAAAGKAADEKIGSVSKSVEDVISHIQNGAEKAHFEAIYAAHPDFMEVSEQPAFQEFVASKGPDAEAIVAGGSAKDINALLDEFKGGQAAPADEAQPAASEAIPAAVAPAEPASPGMNALAAAADAVNEGEIDDMEGVRSAGLRLPEEPKAGADDFEAAWNEA